ncbi:MAG: CoA pyrophosphatase [Myxococcales bacterium]|nr:CoA pyrophosphatase [Myxococcales bacterium]
MGDRSLPPSAHSVQRSTFRYAAGVQASSFRFDDVLRNRIRDHLAVFERVPHHDEKLHRAAVALALLPDEEGRTSFVITRRASKLRAHGGQWALPGGRLDEGETPEIAALRELTEEVGLELELSHVLGLLDDYPTRSGYVITPVVVWADASSKLVPNPEEVAAVYRVPIAELDRPDVPRLHKIPESDRPVISVPLLGTHIHAPTAAILYQLREVAIWGRNTRVAEYEQPVFAWR